jgi:hypothetical protein
MRVSAHDGTQEIGRGTVGRAVVHVPSFVERMQEKARMEVDASRSYKSSSWVFLIAWHSLAKRMEAFGR